MDNGVFAALAALFFCVWILFFYVILHFKFAITLAIATALSAALYFGWNNSPYHSLIILASVLLFFLFFEPVVRTMLKESVDKPDRFYKILTRLSFGVAHWPALSATLVIDIFHKRDFVAARGKIEKVRKSNLYNKLVKNFFCNIILSRIESEQGNYKEAERYLEAANHDFLPGVDSPALESLLKAVRMHKSETGT